MQALCGTTVDYFEPNCIRLSQSCSGYDAFAELGQRWTPFLVANFKAAVPLPSWIKPEEDLLWNAPDPVRQQHSLHVVDAKEAEDWLEVFEQFRAHDALIVVFSEKSRDELLAGLNLYLAWYVQPSILQTNLENGPDHLCRGLMTGVKAILLHTARDHWVVYLAPDVEPPWPQGA